MHTKAYKRYQQEEEREKIIKEFLPVIKHLAYKMAGGISDENVIEDLISAGVIGLLEAMEKFDPKRGIKLNTFAYLRIRGAIVDELRERDWFPRSARTKAKRIEEVVRQLENRFGRFPTEEEIAKEMHLDLDEYLEMVKKFGNLSVVSLEELSETLGIDRENVLNYAIDETTNNPERFAELHELERILGAEIDKLPERQRLVLALYYHEDLNMKEIAGVLSITEARVCQIHAQALVNLRVVMKKHGGR